MGYPYDVWTNAKKVLKHACLSPQQNRCFDYISVYLCASVTWLYVKEGRMNRTTPSAVYFLAKIKTLQLTCPALQC